MPGLATKAGARERILVFGGAGTGKSTTWVELAQRCPDDTFYVLDSDFAVERMTQDLGLTNVEVTVALEWADFVEGVKTAQAKMKPNDWLVIDFIAPAWDAAQAYFTDQIFGKDIAAYFLEARKKKAKGNPLDGDTDWGVINKIYKAWMNNLLAKTPGHILATAPAKAVGDRDDPGVKAMFGSVGVRPEGQKHLAYAFHTVLLLLKHRNGEWQFTTVKDRQRREVEKAPMSSFVNSYMVPIAGWRPTP